MNRTLSLLILVMVMGLSAAVRAEEDPREVDGRALFARGDYDRALEVFSKLFAEKGDPIYLRNIGRCYQQLARPARSISAFREYLRRAKNVRDEERTEVEGFIAEMEAVERRQAKEAEHPAEPTAAVAPHPLLPAAAAPPPASTMVIASPGSQIEAGPSPVYKRWWFWVALGGVVVVGTVTAFALASGGSANRPECPTNSFCPR